MPRAVYFALGGVLILASWWGASVIYCHHAVDELRGELPAGMSLDEVESVLKARGMDYHYGMGHHDRADFFGMVAAQPNLGPLGFLHFNPVILLQFDADQRLSSVELFEGAWFTPP